MDNFTPTLPTFKDLENIELTQIQNYQTQNQTVQISQTDLDDLTQNYQNIIDDFFQSNTLLKQQIIIAQSELEQIQQQQKNEFEKRNTQQQIEILKQQINQIQNNILEHHDFNSINQNVIVDQINFLELEPIIKLKLIELCDQCEIIRQNVFNLMKENSLLQLNNLLNQSQEIFQCMICEKKYIEIFNNEEKCSSHSGQLKFYSCKGCGNDAYYNCCNLCINCSPGCKKSRHKHIINK